MKVVNVDSIDYHLVDGGYYADKDDIDELDSIEMYTKDEVIAMFTELQKEFEGQCKKDNSNIRCYDYNNGISTCYRATQEKIDKLKEKKKEEKENEYINDESYKKGFLVGQRQNGKLSESYLDEFMSEIEGLYQRCFEIRQEYRQKIIEVSEEEDGKID